MNECTAELEAWAVTFWCSLKQDHKGLHEMLIPSKEHVIVVAWGKRDDV